MEQLVKLAIKRALEKLEVVDRTEFDAQREALSRALERARQLEKEVAVLSQKVEILSASNRQN